MTLQLFALPAHSSLPCFPSRGLLGRAGRLSSLFSLACSLYSCDKCFGYRHWRRREKRELNFLRVLCAHPAVSSQGRHGERRVLCEYHVESHPALASCALQGKQIILDKSPHSISLHLTLMSNSYLNREATNSRAWKSERAFSDIKCFFPE